MFCLKEMAFFFFLHATNFVNILSLWYFLLSQSEEKLFTEALDKANLWNIHNYCNLKSPAL